MLGTTVLKIVILLTPLCLVRGQTVGASIDSSTGLPIASWNTYSEKVLSRCILQKRMSLVRSFEVIQKCVSMGQKHSDCSTGIVAALTATDITSSAMSLPCGHILLSQAVIGGNSPGQGGVQSKLLLQWEIHVHRAFFIRLDFSSFHLPAARECNEEDATEVVQITKLYDNLNQTVDLCGWKVPFALFISSNRLWVTYRCFRAHFCHGHFQLFYQVNDVRYIWPVSTFKPVAVLTGPTLQGPVGSIKWTVHFQKALEGWILNVTPLNELGAMCVCQKVFWRRPWSIVPP